MNSLSRDCTLMVCLRLLHLRFEVDISEDTHAAIQDHGAEAANFVCVPIHLVYGTFKVSYYGNPVLDVLTNDGALLSRYPSYRQPNIWLADHLPELDIDLLQLREALGYKWIMFASLVKGEPNISYISSRYYRAWSSYLVLQNTRHRLMFGLLVMFEGVRRDSRMVWRLPEVSVLLLLGAFLQWSLFCCHSSADFLPLSNSTPMFILSAVIASVVSEIGLGSDPVFTVSEYDFRSPIGILDWLKVIMHHPFLLVHLQAWHTEIL